MLPDFFPIFIILRTIFTGVHRYLYVDTDYAFTEEEKKKRQQHQQFYTDFIKQLGQTRLQRVQDRLAFWWMNEFISSLVLSSSWIVNCATEMMGSFFVIASKQEKIDDDVDIGIIPSQGLVPPALRVSDLESSAISETRPNHSSAVPAIKHSREDVTSTPRQLNSQVRSKMVQSGRFKMKPVSSSAVSLYVSSLGFWGN